jgi:hypothetical protein
MANFNINNSKVEQVNDQGDNVKVTGNKGSVAVTKGEGQTVQTTGSENKVSVEKPKDSLLKKAWKAMKGWIVRLFSGGASS